jgi:sialic acid synthase SpsE
VNLKVIEMMKKAFGLPVGFSDHTSGIYAAIASIPMGAVAIEKHFTLDRNMEGPDHKASIEPNELTELVKGVKFAKQAIGSSIKKPVPCEYDNINLIRKSLVAAYDLEKGFKLSRDMIEIKRPQGGIEPCDMDKIIGLTLKNNIEQDKPINWEDIA